MSRKAVIFFRVGTWTLIVTALLHLAGHVAPRTEPANEAERQFWEQVRTHEIEVAGLSRTFMDFLNGFSLTFSAFLIFAGVLNLSVARLASDNDALVGRVTILNALLAAAALALSVAYFIPPPAILFGLALFAFLASAWFQRPASPRRETA